MQDKFFQILSLAAKAGKITSGSYTAERAVKQGRAYLVIVSADSSKGTRKHFTDMCTYRNVPILFYGDAYRLGKCIGKEERSSVVILDKGFADKLISVLKEVVD